MKKSVGLIIATYIPQKDSEGKLAVFLGRRATWDSEENKPESFPGCYQVTCHGGLKEKETFFDALIRESSEELGNIFTNKYIVSSILKELTHKKNTEKEVYTYGILLPHESLSLIQQNASIEKFDLFDDEQINNFVEIKPEFREKGAPIGINAMFQDEINAVKKAFEIFNCK